MENTERRGAGLRARIEKERRSAAGRRVRYSPRLRTDVVSFARESGLTKAQVARVLALSETGVGRWLAREASRAPKLQAVAVVRERATSQRGGLELQFPGGARVVGLSLDDVRQLLGAAR